MYQNFTGRSIKRLITFIARYTNPAIATGASAEVVWRGQVSRTMTDGLAGAFSATSVSPGVAALAADVLASTRAHHGIATWQVNI
jgi:hypothetical protein